VFPLPKKGGGFSEEKPEGRHTLPGIIVEWVMEDLRKFGRGGGGGLSSVFCWCLVLRGVSALLIKKEGKR